MNVQEQNEEQNENDKQEFIRQLKKVGTLGHETEKAREKIFLNQANGIFTIISIYSIVVLYLISFDILDLEGCRLVLFLVLIYMFLLFSLVYSVKTQIQNKY
ncbi:hypothetical protein MmiHf6_08310 [Methanimicrococcus hongohii]|uniref:Uncharacterized protein n=1 Tax=Methanimicrococcus hongohii TaxID=3028295 RepID=A0AA96V1W0_9EURY|nr:hypothetical protein MmiHf6_08310 [Methanimicrococcus sp. Hf6]